MEAGRSLDNKIKRSLCEKALNNHLIMAILSIDGIGIFKVYKTGFIVMDDCIIRYNINYKKFSFRTLLKSKIINLIIELVEKDIIDGEMAVTISQQIQKKFQDISKKGKIKWVNKEKMNK